MMAEVDDPTVNMEYQSSTFQSEDLAIVIPESDFHKVDIKPTETAVIKKKYSRELKRSSPQQNKDLYLKLDKILFAALRQEFEVSPGCTIDRLDMVKFLTDAVRQHLSEYPDLKKLLNLRDTVLTGRVKKVFPEVAYKRRQIKQDHYRKAWLYVNIRRKPSRTTHDGEVKIESVSTTSTWTPPAAPKSTPVHQASSSPSSPAGEEQAGSPHAYTNVLATDSAGTSQYNDECEQFSSGSDGAAESFCPQFSTECEASERTGVVCDNLTLQKWVTSNYIQDNVSYVPVQDVVKAFKRDHGVDISYKECHQMILSAFTSPRNRLIPKKNVRVSSIGQQYVYRGISPINKAASSSVKSQDVDESECAQPNYQSEDSQRETKENWKLRIREIVDERDQALKERNQALAALMELEKDHAEALETIERLKKESSCSTRVENSSRTFKESPNIREISANHYEDSSFGKLLRGFGEAKRDLLAHKDQNFDLLSKNKSDYSLLKEVVTQAKEERDSLIRRLEVVKTERNSYLERLHSLEKENQRLRDVVSVPHSDVSRHRLLDDITLHFQSNCHGENDTKEAALTSVLAHLKSKRKQVTPSRLNKSPKFDRADSNEHSSSEDQTNPSGDSPSPAGLAVDSGIPSPDSLDTSSDGPSSGEPSSNNDKVFDVDTDKLSGVIGRKAGSGKSGSKQDLLVFTSGSEMIGFTRHPLEPDD